MHSVSAGEPPAPVGGAPAALSLADHAPFAVDQAVAVVLADLRRTVGFRFWALSRVTGQTYVVAATGPDGFPGAAGAQFPWADTLCRKVLDGQAPRVAPDIAGVPTLGDLPLTQEWQVRAYLSVPVTLDGATLFGTVCAVDPQPQPPEVATAVELVDRQARLLSTLLAAELRADTASRRAERAQAEALTDALTGLVNRRGWDSVLEREEQRCQRYGAMASVLVVDLDGLKAVNDSRGHAAGDELLRRAAEVLRGAVRSADVVARFGGDEFAVLAVETDLPAAHGERDRLQVLLRDAGIAASVGAAARDPQGGLAAALVAADAEMYRAKGEQHR